MKRRESILFFKLMIFLVATTFYCFSSFDSPKQTFALTERQQEEVDFYKQIQAECNPEDYDETSFWELENWYIDSVQLIQEKALEICQNLSTDEEKVLAIHDWIAENIAYDYEQLQAIRLGKSTPGPHFSAFVYRRGLCGDFEQIAKAMFSAVGIPCIGVGGYPIGSDWSHGWNIVWLNGKWQILDITWDCNNGYYGPENINNTIGRKASHTYYLIDPVEFADTHISKDIGIAYLEQRLIDSHDISNYPFEFEDMRSGKKIEYSADNGKPALILLDFGTFDYEHRDNALSTVSSLLPFIDKECQIFYLWGPKWGETEEEKNKDVLSTMKSLEISDRIMGTCRSNVVFDGRKGSEWRFFDRLGIIRMMAGDKIEEQWPEPEEGFLCESPLFCFVNSDGEIVSVIDSTFFDYFSDNYATRDKELLDLFALITDVYDDPNPDGYDFTVIKKGVKYRISKQEPYEAEVIGLKPNFSGSLVLDSSIQFGKRTYTVTKIGEKAFYKNKNITGVSFSKEITEIGKNAFYGCEKLFSISLPEKLKKIGSKAFYKCKILKYITYKGTKLKKIGSKAFKGIASDVNLILNPDSFNKFKKLFIKAGISKNARFSK